MKKKTSQQYLLKDYYYEAQSQMDSSRSWAGRRQCPLSCQAKGRSNRIKKSSPLFIISQDETRDNPGICGDKAGQ
uniref:HDC11352 n=1 Tax=Drosophila melanogaster TaxID=7227 RepID=Q6IKV4_DROME|nr:TPA_inf: HDC11352 [Drosophila melanogaster]